jgi:pimeloyl-ACP methyl ester carboxylesterase
VLDAEGVTQAAVFGVGFGGLAALLLAATHLERIRAVVLMNSYACIIRSDDYPFGVPADRLERFSEAVVEPGGAMGDDLALMSPSLCPIRASPRGGAERVIGGPARQ